MFKRTLMTALAFSGAAFGQETPPAPAAVAPATADGRVSYDAAFYTQFSPHTAMDMVSQTPGFTLDGGDDRRGFSGAVGNVLIDGLRPSAKTQSLSAILGRIPANQVVRIELLRGADVAGDASGQAVLLNVVRTPSGGSGSWDTGFEVTSTHVISPRLDASYSGRAGQTEYGVGLSYDSRSRSLPGERRAYDPSGVFLGRIETPSPRNFKEASLNANAATPLWGGRISATGAFNWFHFEADNDFLAFDPAGVNTENLFSDYMEREPGFEIGVNYDRDIGPWGLALVGLANRSTYESSELATSTDGSGAVLSVFSQDVSRERGETILRGALSRGFSTQRIEVGIEGALNTLDAELDFTEDTGAGPVPLDIPNSNVLVEERRVEAFAVHTWRPVERWSLETRLAREASTLEFTGDANQSVDLAFWKPSIQLSRSFGTNNQARVRVFRDVGQLDFDDFVSAAAISDNLISGGNPELRPETSWQAQIATDLRFPGDAALSLTLTHAWISDAADVVQVIVPGENPGDPDIRFDAPGNIGDGEATELDITLSLPLGRFIPGGRLTVDGELWHGEVTDPVTGRGRTMSFHSESSLEISFRQDIASLKLAWGIEYEKQGEVQAYRFNEIDTQEEGPWVDLFVETTALPYGMKLRGWAANILDGDVRRQRNFFTPDRAGATDRYEERQRIFETAPWFILQLSGTF